MIIEIVNTRREAVIQLAVFGEKSETYEQYLKNRLG